MNTATVIPNTNEELRGKKPRAWEKKFNLDNQICDNCRSKWSEKGKVHCEVCASKKAMYAAAHRTDRKKLVKKKDRNPTMVDIIVSAAGVGRTLDTMDIRLTSDTGAIVTVRNVSVALKYIDRKGTVHTTVFRDKEVNMVAESDQPTSPSTRAKKLSKAKKALFAQKGRTTPGRKPTLVM